MEDDNGHQVLLHDIAMLMQDAADFIFHDFHKNGLDTPKLALVQRLESLADNAKKGRYDN